MSAVRFRVDEQFMCFYGWFSRSKATGFRVASSIVTKNIDIFGAIITLSIGNGHTMGDYCSDCCMIRNLEGVRNILSNFWHRIDCVDKDLLPVMG